MFLGGASSRRPPIARTGFHDDVETLLVESSCGVVHIFLYLDDLCEILDKMGAIVVWTKKPLQGSNPYFVFMAPFERHTPLFLRELSSWRVP